MIFVTWFVNLEISIHILKAHLAQVYLLHSVSSFSLVHPHLASYDHSWWSCSIEYEFYYIVFACNFLYKLSLNLIWRSHLTHPQKYDPILHQSNNDADNIWVVSCIFPRLDEESRHLFVEILEFGFSVAFFSSWGRILSESFMLYHPTCGLSLLAPSAAIPLLPPAEKRGTRLVWYNPWRCSKN